MNTKKLFEVGDNHNNYCHQKLLSKFFINFLEVSKKLALSFASKIK